MAVPTERSQFWTTGGAGDGATTFTRDQMAEGFRAAFLADPTTQGPFAGLAVSGVASPMTLAIGSACVYGFFYLCTVAGDVTKSTPVVGTTGFRIVLRASWAAQTVRVTVISSADGTAAIPAATQSAGVTWDITLATGTITTGGVITLTDARTFAHFQTAVSTAMLDALAVTAAKIATGTITPTQIADRTRTLFVPCTGGYNATDATPITIGTGGFPGSAFFGLPLADNKNCYGGGSFIAPSDFVSALSVAPIINAISSGNVYSGMVVNSGAAGELWNTDIDTTAIAARAVTHDVIKADFTLNLASTAVGDYSAVTYQRDASNVLDTSNNTVYLLGFLITYTADS